MNRLTLGAKGRIILIAKGGQAKGETGSPPARGREKATMATTTVTRASVLNKVLDNEQFLSDEERDVLVKMLASITKPRKAAEGPTKTQLMNANLADQLVSAMALHGEPVSAKWISENVPGINTAQKAVAVVHAAGERIVKFYDQRNALYRLA